MAMGHHHHHHHHAADDAHEAPLDAANQSLADALRASFSILKVVMFAVLILYCFSGVQCIDENEQAVVFRFGTLLPEVREPGLSWAFPEPIDETLRFPTKKDNTFKSNTHWPRVQDDRQSLSLDKVRGGGGLNPARDGSLLTADRGMVHMKWEVKYRIDDLRQYVLYVADEKTTDVEGLLTALLERNAIRVVSQYTAEAVTRGQTAAVANAVKAGINEELDAMETGVVVVGLDIPRSSVPGQTIAAFDAVTNAENEKQKQIRDAEQKRADILNAAAGAAWQHLISHRDDATGEEKVGLLDQLEAAQVKGDEVAVARLSTEIDALIETRAGGAAGQAIRRAKAYYTQVVQQVKGDVEQYQAVLPEYLGSRDLFTHRMWEDTRQRVLQLDSVKKHFISGRLNEIRIKIGPDPLQRELDEQEKLRKEAEKYDFSGPKKRHIVMPEDPA